MGMEHVKEIYEDKRNINLIVETVKPRSDVPLPACPLKWPWLKMRKRRCRF